MPSLRHALCRERVHIHVCTYLMPPDACMNTQVYMHTHMCMPQAHADTYVLARA